MTDNYYFPLNANIMEDENICRLIADKGMKGFGIYIAMLVTLRRKEGYKSGVDTLNLMAFKLGTTSHMIRYLIYTSGLFVVEPHATFGDCYYSPYLTRVMEKLDAERRSRSEAGKKGAAVKAEIKAQKCLSNAQAEEKRKEEKRKEENSTTNFWEKLVDEVAAEQSWMEIIAMQSGIESFMNHIPQAVEAFKRHVKAQGTESQILTNRDAKMYFANFTRQYTPTGNRLKALIEQKQETKTTEDPYRHEQRDPITGKRSYFGNPIPDDAPPRPTEMSAWHDPTKRWYY